MALNGGIAPGDVTVSEAQDALTISVSGSWTVREIDRLDPKLRRIAGRRAGRVVLDLSKLERLDTAGAWMIERIRRRLSAEGMTVEVTGSSPDHETLIAQVAAAYEPCAIEPATGNVLLVVLRHVGQSMVNTGREVLAVLGFGGLLLTALWHSLINWRLRVTSLVHHMEQAGFNAVPIIALMSFLIGAVIAFLGSDILSTFGVETYTVSMLSYSVLREFGVFLTAILVAGRSGSGFTAQIGSMKGHEEIDAMRTLGLDPMEMLVVPRVLALLITVPLLTFVANIAGLVGGGLVCISVLDMSPVYYMEKLKDSLVMNDIWAGFVKAPVFAFLIGLIGCHQGFQVEGSAESVGNRTTLSVVESIFVVIVFDALFAAYFVFIDF